MDWFKLHRKAIAIVLVLVGGVLFLAGVAFFFIDAQLMKEIHMSAATLMNLAESFLQGSIGMGQSILDSPLGDYGLALVNGLGIDGVLEMVISNLPPEDQLTVRTALFVLPLIPYKWTFTLVGLLVLAMGLLLLRPAKVISFPGIGKGPVIFDPPIPRGPGGKGPRPGPGTDTGSTGYPPYDDDFPPLPGPGSTWSPPGPGDSGYTPYHRNPPAPPDPGGTWHPSGYDGTGYHPGPDVTFYAPVPKSPPYPIGVVPIPYSPEPTGSCPYCGAALRADARFCGQCGHPLEGGRPPANTGLQAAGPL